MERGLRRERERENQERGDSEKTCECIIIEEM